ncbi:MAG: hypothetical protein RLZZ450_149 [Pseudomonadota bacterium]|jgi:hypothetical protein
MRRVSSVALTLVVGACSLGAELPDGRIRCNEPSDCPSHWTCRVSASNDPPVTGLCYRAAIDAGAPALASREGDAAFDAADGARDAEHASTDPGATPDAAEQAVTDAATFLDASAALVDAETPADASSVAPDAAPVVPDASTGPKPRVDALSLRPRYLNPAQQASVACIAADPTSSPLSFLWSADQGRFDSPTASSTAFTAARVGLVHVSCEARNAQGGSALKMDELRVYPSGWLTLLRFSLDATDLSGHHNDGTVVQGSYGVDRSGASAAAIELSGTGNISLPNESAFDLAAFSFVATLRPTPGHGGTIVSKGDDAFGAFAIFLYPDNDPGLPGRLQYFQATSAGPSSFLLGSYAARGNTFFQLAVTRSQPGELQAYVDGVAVYRQTNVPPALLNDAPVVLGAGPLGAYWGTLDEVQIYDRVLDASEVSALTGLP